MFTLIDKASYWPRLSDGQVELALQTLGAVSIEGPKWCGKTTSALRLAKSSFSLIEHSVTQASASSMAEALDGETPRLIDE